MTHFTLNFFCRTLESFCVWCVTSSNASVRQLFWLLEIKGFLWHLFCGPVVLQPLLCHLLLLIVISGQSSVHWWCIRYICAAGRSPATCLMCLAVTFELSIFLANCQTLLAGNFWISTFPSFIVLVTNCLSFIKNQNMPLWRILVVSRGYFAKLTCAWTALYHLSTFLFPWWKLVSRSKWALTSMGLGFWKLFKSNPYNVQYELLFG